MSDSITLRELTETDLQSITDIEQQLNTFPWSYKNFSDCFVAGYPAWVLCENLQVIGFIIVQKIVDELHLLNIGVQHSSQGKGLGRLLLDHIMSYGEEELCKTILLEVRASNKRAQDLYLKNGFNEMSLRRDYYPAEQGREDAVLMAKELSFLAFLGQN